MDSFLKIIGIGIFTLITYLIVKPIKPDIAIFLGVVGSCVILIQSIDSLTVLIETMTNFVERTGINSSLFKSVLKMVGIGYLAEISSSLCISSGNSTIADAISFAGKVTILVYSIPIISNLLDLIIELLPKV